MSQSLSTGTPGAGRPLPAPARLVAGVLAAVLAAVLLLAGALPASAATYTIKGKVTGKASPSGTPAALGDVWVGAYTTDWQSDNVGGSWSAPDGTYSFTVPAGSYNLWISCSSSCENTYADEWHQNHTHPTSADPVTVSDAVPTLTIDPQLEAYGKMAGRVTDQAGQPLAGISVSANPEEGGRGSYTTTDANGAYTLAKIPPGSTSITASDESGQQLYKQMSWDGTKAVTGGVATTVPAGADWTNADFTMVPESVFEATLTDEAGAPLADVGYTPLVYNESTAAWDGPQMGPLMSDADGKVYWRLTPGKKYKFCFSDTHYGSYITPREFRYKAECYDNSASADTAKVVTAVDGQRVKAAVQMAVEGRSLEASEPFAYGSAQVGQTLSVDPGIWGPAPVTLAYQWVRAKGSTTTDIPGATASNYTVTSADNGYDLLAEVTGSKDGYVSYTSSAHAGTAGAEAITASKPLTLTGEAAVGQRLTADFGTLTPAPEYGESYEWYVNGVRDDRSYGKTFDIVPADFGKKITVRVSAYDWPLGPYTGQASSAAVVAGTLTAPAPTITGTAKVGYKLTAAPGSWGPAPVTLKYQWFRSGEAITGATASTYTLTSADLAKTMTVRVTGSKTGYATAAKTSAATAAVVAGTLTAPTPTITGTKKVGYTLTANPGTWGPAPVTLKYQWYRGTTAISGATYQTYKLAAADKGQAIKVRVTGSKAGYTSLSRYSAATTAVVAGTLTAPTPTITGTKKVGYTLTANPGTWGPAPVTLKYQWYRGTTAISGATYQTYKLTAADKGQAIKVRVTGSKAGYTSVSKYSAATSAIY